MSDRCLYTKIKDSYDNATLNQLIKKIPDFKKFLIWYIVLFLTAVLSFASITWDNPADDSFLLIFKPIILVLITLTLMIYIVMYKLAQVLKKHYSSDKYNKLDTHRKGWQAARYQLFKELLEKLNIESLDKIYVYIKEEKDFPRETLWDHKFIVTFITFLMISWGGVVKTLATDGTKSILIGVFAISLILIPLIWMFLSAIQTDNEKHKELKLFLSWYECEFLDEKKEEETYL